LGWLSLGGIDEGEKRQGNGREGKGVKGFTVSESGFMSNVTVVF
jgi:hypothetical protein